MSVNKSSATLNTSRLTLLPVHEGLAARAADFFQRNAQHLAPWEPPQAQDFASEAYQRESLKRAAESVAAGIEARWWLQATEDPTQLIGNISLTQIARGAFQNAMLGYAIDGAFEGLGLMREALQAVIENAFSPELDLHRIQASIRPENTRSVALLRRLGFEQEGLAQEYLYIDGAWRDHVMFAIRNRLFVNNPTQRA